MNLMQGMNYILALLLCFLHFAIGDNVFNYESTDYRLLEIILSQNGQEILRYPAQSQIDYFTVNSKDDSIKKQMLRWNTVLEGLQYRQQKQAHRRNSAAREQDLRAFFLSKYMGTC
jgi:hypothetical protein